jgi:hypothetical protein
MICIQESGYTLRQIPGHNVTYVTPWKGKTKRVVGPILSPETVKKIITSLGK